MGPLLSRLSQHLENQPSEEPGLFFYLNKEYFKRIDSMQFAFTHDDGQRYYEYEKAEIVLVGVSRTFKTPLSIFLAFKGWFVANYPIVLGVNPPDILGQLPLCHVFGLTTHPADLSRTPDGPPGISWRNTGDYFFPRACKTGTELLTEHFPEIRLAGDHRYKQTDRGNFF